MKRIFIFSLFFLSLGIAQAKNSRMIEFQISRGSCALESFKQRISQGNILVDFYGPQCGPCKRIAPLLDELSCKYTNITFLKVDTGAHPTIAQAYNVRSIPQLLYFKNGELLETTVGQKSKTDIDRCLRKHFNN